MWVYAVGGLYDNFCSVSPLAASRTGAARLSYCHWHTAPRLLSSPARRCRAFNYPLSLSYSLAALQFSVHADWRGLEYPLSIY
jgi:hypothetical protein